MAVATVGLVVLLPVMLVVALLVKLDSKGPILYRAQRVGRYGREFRLYKFRSMGAGAHKHGPPITGRDDPRITRLGRILRTSRIDELPQLVNVIRGDMSIVGPRPEDPTYVAFYTPEQFRILSGNTPKGARGGLETCRWLPFAPVYPTETSQSAPRVFSMTTFHC